MSRRKQARPSRAHLEEELAQGPLLINAVENANETREENDFTSDGEESGGGGGGGDEAVDLTAARSHQGDEDDKDQEDALEEDEEEGVDEQDDQEDDEEGSRKQMRHRQDAENNNNFVESGAPAGLFPPAGTSHVTLEALQNTKVAVAQFAATALAGGADSEAALQDLALLQSTLYTLQHQQVFQLQLISQLQQQLSITHSQTSQQQPASEPSDSKEVSPSPIIQPKPLSSLTSPPSSRPPSHQQTSPVPMTPNLSQERPTPTSSASPLNLPLPSSNATGTTAISSSSSSQVPMSHQMLPLCSISSSLASSIITNTDPPPLHEPNTLEMLQKRAQEVLDNASQGLLANNLADELAFRGGKGSRLSPYDSKSGSGRGEPFFKHRCRYCGKVFGSDSALQIHIRSHTGERPFKCNVCGSRFTTKGNLKVHFQRHTAKFPHVKMNPNPVPEHLDKYHPPLLQQIASGQRPMPSPPPPPPSHHPSFHPAAAAHGFLPPQPPLPLSLALPGMPPLYRSPVVAHRDDQDVPENLTKPVTTAPTMSPHSPAIVSNSRHSSQDNHQQQKQQLEQRDEIKREQRSPMHEQYQQRPTSQEAAERITPKKEPEEAEEPTEEESEDFEETTRRYLNSPQSSVNPPSQPQTYEDCSMESKISGRLEGDGDMEVDEEIEEQPENLSGRGTMNRLPQQMLAYPGASPASSSASSGSLQTSFAGILFPGPPGHHQIPHHAASSTLNTPVVSTGEMIDPSKDPAIYSSLLPRPGSNDNSWESLIEITKTSETSKLQQLVDNIEHKLTDPNQCVICHRVLSCKSALQMHYRTHTGERPFKCKICGRAFTTKGNLKTHMGVHRAKPPLRVLHQCPVCHKKFTNALVLQQHIRLHTGEPTELSPEQIQAGEVNEFPPGYPHHPLASFLPQGFPPIHPAGPGFPLSFPPARHQAMERQLQENDMSVKEESQQQHQQQQQQQRYSEEHSEEADDQEDDEEDRREDDERCDVNRDCRGDVEDEQDHESEENEQKDLSLPSFSTSLAALENQVRTITTIATSVAGHPSRSPPFHRYNGSEKSNSPINAGTPLDLTPRASSTPAAVASVPTPPPQTVTHHPHPFGMFAGLLQAVSSSPSASSIGSSSINSVSSMNAVTPGPGAAGPLASLTTSAVLAATSTYNPLGLAVGGPAVRGNTTCNICYKTFACNSALEIHYRSHTKERPFKCSICDRGFSTKNNTTGQQTCVCTSQPLPANSSITSLDSQYRSPCASNREKPKRRRRRPEERKSRGRKGAGGGRGLTPVYPAIRLPPLMSPALGLLPSAHGLLGNMKQHMLTHKIRDMPPHLFSDSKQQSQEHETSRSPMCAEDTSLPLPPPPPPPPPPMPPSSMEQALSMKRSPPEGDLPAPKRPASMPSKHLCQICNKNFSSSSALQIHMRTHTGDKPFRCTVCQKAFTTKGNLKVHMGTHMWTNGASRRGRRMSLDLPPLPITPKDSEFLQRRPDLFYPYLPAPFLNGVQQKLNEISVIQSNNGLPGHSVAGGKYAGLFGSVYAAGAGFPLDKQPMAATSNGPLVDGKSSIPSGSMLFQTPSPSHSPGTPSSNSSNQNSASVPAWTGDGLQHHFDREAPSRSESNSTPPTARLPPPPSATRGEGLAT